MKVNTEMIEKLAEVRLLDLEDVTTPEEMVELGVELVMVGTQRVEQRRRRRARGSESSAKRSPL